MGYHSKKCPSSINTNMFSIISNRLIRQTKSLLTTDYRFESCLESVKKNAAILISLFIVSVATLILAVFGDGNTLIYSVATIISHLALIGFGYFYARNSRESLLADLRKDILGE